MQPAPHAAPPDDKPFFGFRYLKRALPGGGEEVVQVPLTLEDLLHPQEEDSFCVRPVHHLDGFYLHSVFSSRRLGPPVAYVAGELLIDWGVPGVGNHQPDVALFVGLSRSPEPEAGTLRLAELGGRCVMVLEVVSPDSRVNDLIKIGHYHRAGVLFYVLVDQERTGGERRLVAYQYAPDGYEPVELDEQGRLYLPDLDIFLVMRDNRPVCIDATTGNEVGDYQQLRQDVEERDRELQAADRRAQEQERALEESIEARRSAKRRAKKERKAREDAEQKASAAEQKARVEAKAREDAEQKTRDAEQRAREAQAALESRLRELEAALLKAVQPPS